MDNKDHKYDIVLEIIENHHNYTSVQLDEILADPETREIYNILCKTDSAIDSDKSADVDAEWEKFSNNHPKARRRAFKWVGSRAAGVAIIVCTSLVAIAAGIAISVAVKDRQPEMRIEKATETADVAIPVALESVGAPQDSVLAIKEPVMFEDDTLEDIIRTIAATYEIEYTFKSRETASLHLYYRLDPALTLDEVISQLNTFEQIRIIRSGSNLSIE